MSVGGTNLAAPLEAASFSKAPPGRSLWQDAFSRLRHNRAAVASGILLCVIVFASIVVPWISPYNYYTPQWTLLDSAAHVARRPHLRHR